MRIQFFDDPTGSPKARESVRFNQLGLFVYEDGRRVAVGFDMTPFSERPSIEVKVTNQVGKEAATLSVIEAMQPNFNLTLHLRDETIANPYQVEAELYYLTSEGERVVVDTIARSFDTSVVGNQ